MLAGVGSPFLPEVGLEAPGFVLALAASILLRGGYGILQEGGRVDLLRPTAPSSADV